MSTNRSDNPNDNRSENSGAATWPADVIHVNEDGWLLINRGAQQGVPVGMRLLVVGAGTRTLRDLFPAGAQNAQPRGQAREDQAREDEEDEEGEESQEGTAPVEEPVVLRTRRTYELLEVVHVEPACAVAIAARTPAERRPQFYRGPEGDLLVWVPLPAAFTYPQPAAEEEEDDDEEPYDQEDEEAEHEVASGIDTPPQRSDQEDERWEQALPLNGVGVGDQVVPAVLVSGASSSATGSTMRKASGAGATSSTSADAASSTLASGDQPLTPFEQGRSYDWMKPQS
jgi:hypothetical protein